MNVQWWESHGITGISWKGSKGKDCPRYAQGVDQYSQTPELEVRIFMIIGIMPPHAQPPEYHHCPTLHREVVFHFDRFLDVSS